ncbi:WxL domain-containing protein [Aquipuribacter sp. MA13-6]|uniref:WxL domain-containing protein n=1 Tax=unclassified Aquipuribacter TaxID=2635084 RepID=UPI003EE83A14
MSRSRTRTCVAVLAAAALVTTGAAPALADTVQDPSDVTVTAGTLEFSTDPTVGDFAPVTLNSESQDVDAAVGTFSVSDNTGSGAGWTVTVQASQMAEHNGTDYVGSGRTLPTSSIELSAPTVGAAAGTTSAVPAIAPGPYTVDAGAAVTIATAAPGAGMGTYDFGATTATLTVPSDAYAATYRSDVTVTLATTP